jgi:hypothetical protein
VIQRHSRSVDVARHVCSRCKGKLLEIEAPRKGTNRADIVKTPKKKVPMSEYNIFVRQTSSEIRDQLIKDRIMNGVLTPKVSQSEVMKECARLWNEGKKKVSSV